MRWSTVRCALVEGICTETHACFIGVTDREVDDVLIDHLGGLLRGTIFYRTCGIHKKYIYGPIFTIISKLVPICDGPP